MALRTFTYCVTLTVVHPLNFSPSWNWNSVPIEVLIPSSQPQPPAPGICQCTHWLNEFDFSCYLQAHFPDSSRVQSVAQHFSIFIDWFLSTTVTLSWIIGSRMGWDWSRVQRWPYSMHFKPEITTPPDALEFPLVTLWTLNF